MSMRATIDEFLGHKKLALVRPSSTKPVVGGRIDDELSPKGYEVSVVYLNDGDPGPRIASVKDQVEGVIVAVPRAQSEKAVKEALDAGVPRVWLQNGCESAAAIALCEAGGVPVVHGACVLMYAEPVRSVHAFHRWLWKTLGLLKK